MNDDLYLFIDIIHVNQNIMLFVLNAPQNQVSSKMFVCLYICWHTTLEQIHDSIQCLFYAYLYISFKIKLLLIRWISKKFYNFLLFCLFLPV